jgi:hypothetical protein
MNEDSKNNVVAIVSHHTKVPVQAIMTKSKGKREITDARYFCMRIMFEELKISKSEIGEFFGKHHTTAMYGIKEIRTLCDLNYDKRLLYDKMLDSIASSEPVAAFEDKYTELLRAYAQEKLKRKRLEAEARRLKTENFVIKSAYGYKKNTG